MSKKSFLILAAGGIAGWVAAKRLFGESEGWAASSNDAFDKDGPAPTPLWDSRPESLPARPVVTGGDPFRGAFAGAIAEIDAHADDEESPDTQVA
jgi:hypothetical protein